MARGDTSHSIPEQTIGDNLQPEAIALYQEQEFWKRETCVSCVRDWSPAQSRAWVEAFDYNKQGVATLTPKHRLLLTKVMDIMEQHDMDGNLLLAGGEDYLREKALSVLFNKADRMRLARVVRLVFVALHEAQAMKGNLSYWERLERESQAGEAFCVEFQNTPGNIGKHLRMALAPHPLESICYTAICHLEEARNVIEANYHVCQHMAPPSSTTQRLFLVVSIVPRDDPTVVWSNLIYVRSDAIDIAVMSCDQPEQADNTAVSRKERRKVKRENKSKQQLRWELLASVDFAQHGSAKPGHWHLNLTSGGDILPHLSLSTSAKHHSDDAVSDERRRVWHGSEYGCPVWWQFLPRGMSYKCMPQRIKTLFKY